MMPTAFRHLLALAALGAVSACSGKPGRVASAPPAAVRATAAEVDAAFALLMQGKEKEAARAARAMLKRDPMSASARLLLDSIERDPKDLLGPASYPYTVRAGDTPLGLAERFLGNRLKAYQFLRYNGLKAPAVLAAGQVLRIPGEPPRPEPVRRAEPAPAPRPAAPAPKPAVAAPAPAPAPRPRVVPADPVTVRTVRAAGLAALNAGKLDRAVALLQRAATLDPDNPAIARDLARARRIEATVRARR